MSESLYWNLLEPFLNCIFISFFIYYFFGLPLVKGDSSFLEPF